MSVLTWGRALFRLTKGGRAVALSAGLAIAAGVPGAGAATFTLTLTNTVDKAPLAFAGGNSTIATGDVFTGTFTTTSYSSAPGARFDITSFKLSISDGVSGTVIFDSTNTAFAADVIGNAKVSQLVNDADGKPSFIGPNTPETVAGFQADYVQWAIPALNITSDPNATYYGLGFNPGPTRRDQFVFSRAILGSGFGVETLASGLYSIAAVPLPGGFVLLVGGLCGLSLLRRRRL
jgi:hypothetical protein